jgi:hypothetical protein
VKAIEKVIVRSRRVDPAKDSGFDGFAETDGGKALLSQIVSTPPSALRTTTSNTSIAGSGRARVRFTGLTAALLVLGLASAAGAAYWVTARTGRVVEGPTTEQVEGSEIIRVDAPDLGEVVEEVAEGYPLPPGFTTERLTSLITTAEPTEMDIVGLELSVASITYCGWAREWLNAETAGRTKQAQKAAEVLTDMPKWRIFQISDGDGGLMAKFHRISEAVNAHDRDPVARDVAINCR